MALTPLWRIKWSRLGAYILKLFKKQDTKNNFQTSKHRHHFSSLSEKAPKIFQQLASLFDVKAFAVVTVTFNEHLLFQLTFTCSKSAIESLEKGGKYV